MQHSIENLLMMAINRLTPTCESITKKVSKSLDRRLSLIERLQVNLHLMYCDYCNRYRQQLLVIRKVLQKRMEKTVADDTNGGLSDEARENIEQALNERFRSSPSSQSDK